MSHGAGDRELLVLAVVVMVVVIWRVLPSVDAVELLAWLLAGRCRCRRRRKLAALSAACFQIVILKARNPPRNPERSGAGNPSRRRARRGTGPLASERPCGPLPPLGAASCGLLAVDWPSTAPAPRCCRCRVWAGRDTECLRLPAAWPCPAPPTGTHRTHVRAGLLLLRAAVHSTAGSLLPSPPHTNSIPFPL